MSVQEIPADLMFYISAQQPCSYLPGQQQLNLFADPNTRMDPALYSVLCELGFRRSGEYVYAPRCPSCQACLPVRLPVAEYRPNRSQRRNWRDNADLQVKLVEAQYHEEHFRLYQRYLLSRHPDGSMSETDPAQFQRFFGSSWSDTRYLEFRQQGQLLAVSVVDLLRDGLSAVYTFFDPDAQQRGLGVYAVQWMIAETARRGLSHLYLGYLIHDCDKMAYKARYRPLEVFRQGSWQELENPSNNSPLNHP
ncbi:MAG: arginyltransferase [Chromatiales bacterium]|nr:arginyltransferase [Chromatiales bacterium]